MVFQNLFRRLGFWTAVFTWSEPTLFRVRLNGDTGPRALCALGIGAAATAALLGLFAVNNNPPAAEFSLLGLLVVGGLAAAALFFGAGQSARVRVCEEGITRKRQGFDVTAAATGGVAFDEVSWPYAAIQRVVLVPGPAIQRSFAALLVELPTGVELLGIPASVQLEELVQFLTARQVRVQYGTSIPQEFRGFFPWPAGTMTAVVGAVACVFAMVFYSVQVGNAQQAAEQRFQRPKNLLASSEIPELQRDWMPAGSHFRNEKSEVASATPPPPPPPAASGKPETPLLPPGFGERGPVVRPKRGAGGLRNDTVPDQESRPTNSAPVAAPATLPATVPARKAVDLKSQTTLIGGPGGFPFQKVNASEQPVVGVRWRVGSWGGKAALSLLEPLAERSAAANGPSQVTVGREGYVVGGMQVNATTLVHAVRIIFVRRQEDGAQIKSDFYLSEWIGTPTEEKPVAVGDGTTPVQGICGRRGAAIDAIGLVLAPRAE